MPRMAPRVAVRSVRLLASLLLSLALAGCGDEKSLVRVVNTPPEVRSLTADPDTLGFGDTAQVACSTFDPDRDILRHRWVATVGRFISRDPSLNAVRWIAPEVEGPASVSVTVDDGSDSVIARVDLLVMGPSGTLVGHVVDDASSEPLAGAVLQIAGREVHSGPDGGYRLSFLPLGVDTLRASLDGYHPWSRVMAVREAIDTVEVRLDDVELVTRLHGVVRNRRDEVVSGAICRAATVETTTNASGAYEFLNVPRGRQILQVRATGYATRRDTLDLVEAEVQHDLVLDLAIPGRPAGQLTAQKQADLRIFVSWTPEEVDPTLDGFDLLYSVDEGPSIPLGVGRIPAQGGTRSFTGVEHGRYRFSVVGVNFEGQSGIPSELSPVIVLTYPTATASLAAGAMVMGNHPDGWGNETHPGNPVAISSVVRLETLEVTNRQYLAFLLEALERGQLTVSDTAVRSGETTLLLFAGSKIDPDPALGFTMPVEVANHPVTGVTWAGAEAYARRIGRRLPTEAEWELAARGRSTEQGTWPGGGVGLGTIYPWGNDPPGQYRANFGGLFNTTRSVGSYPLGVADWNGVAVHDLAGNVAEWCADWYAPYATPHQPPSSGTYRVVRGGHYASGSVSSAPELRAAHRASQLPEAASPRVGFRCAE